MRNRKSKSLTAFPLLAKGLGIGASTGGPTGPVFAEYTAGQALSVGDTVILTGGEVVEPTIAPLGGPPGMIIEGEIDSTNSAATQRIAWDENRGCGLFCRSSGSTVIARTFRYQSGNLVLGTPLTISTNNTVRGMELLYSVNTNSFLMVTHEEVSATNDTIRVRVVTTNTNFTVTAYNAFLLESAGNEIINMRADITRAGQVLCTWIDVLTNGTGQGPIRGRGCRQTGVTGVAFGTKRDMEASSAQRSKNYIVKWNNADSKFYMAFGDNGVLARQAQITINSVSGLGTPSGINNFSPTTAQSPQGWSGSQSVFDFAGNRLWIAYIDGSTVGDPQLKPVIQNGATPTEQSQVYEVTTNNAQHVSINFFTGKADNAQHICYFYENTLETGNLFFAVYDTTGSSNTATVSVSNRFLANAEYTQDRLWSCYDPANRDVWVTYRDANGSRIGLVGAQGTPASNNDQFIGIVQSDGADGQQVLVAVSGQVAGGFNGLSNGTTYYVADEGGITTTNTGVVAGVAQSATELLVA